MGHNTNNLRTTTLTSDDGDLPDNQIHYQAMLPQGTTSHDGDWRTEWMGADETGDS